MVHVRVAGRSDARLLRQLIAEMAHHEHLPVLTSKQRLVRDGFGPAPKFGALIAEADNKVAGYALYFDCYSSFQGSGIFLEDLFVRDEFRGRRIGSGLLSRIAEIAIDRGDFGIMLNVLEWNTSALRFFENAGASVVHERQTLCITELALRGIALSESTAATG